jgi:hypothetical protein
MSILVELRTYLLLGGCLLGTLCERSSILLVKVSAPSRLRFNFFSGKFFGLVKKISHCVSSTFGLQCHICYSLVGPLQNELLMLVR